jgi:hypothetical protein
MGNKDINCIHVYIHRKSRKVQCLNNCSIGIIPGGSREIRTFNLKFPYHPASILFLFELAIEGSSHKSSIVVANNLNE